MEKDNNNNNMIFKQKRTKIKIIDDPNDNECYYYQPKISEHETVETIKCITYNKNMPNNENMIKMEKKRKKNIEIRQGAKKVLTIKQKKLKNLINKISSPTFKLKCAFIKWTTITFKHKKDVSACLNKSEEEEEDEEDEDEEEEEEDEEYDGVKSRFINDLNVIGLSEIEERPPNEEESALTSIMAKAGKNKNKICVALRKIIKYKNYFYPYFYHWQKIINKPNILLILQSQKLLKNSIINLEKKKNLSQLSLKYKEWKRKSEKLKLNEKKAKKKKKVIIYKKKNGEIEIKNKEEFNTSINDNKSEYDNSSVKTKKDKAKKIKIKTIKKNISSLKTSNNNEEKNNFDIQNNPKSSRAISINRIESSDDILNNKAEGKITKSKKIIKKVNKIIKIVKKDKDNEYEEKVFSKTTELLPDLSKSTGHFKIMNSFNLLDNNNNINDNDMIETDSLSPIKKAIDKKKMKKVNRREGNKSVDLLITKDKKITNNSFSNSSNRNIESIIDKIEDIFHGKDNDNDTEESDKKVKKKKIQNLKNLENKTLEKKIKKEESKNNNVIIDVLNISETGEDKKQLSYGINKKKEFKILSSSNGHFNSKIKQSDFVEFSVEGDSLNNDEKNDYIFNSINVNDSKEIKMRKKNNNGNIELKKEENLKYKKYNKAFLILKKAIKSFKTRKKSELNDKEQIYNFFNKIKNIQKEAERKNSCVSEKTRKISKNSHLNLKKRKNSLIINNKNNKDTVHKICTKKKVESEKNKLLNKIVRIAESNNKIQNDIINVIKRTDKKTLNNLDLGNYVKMLEANNKKLYAYKIFCLFCNYCGNSNFCMKNSNPKKYYFNHWNKNNSNI